MCTKQTTDSTGSALFGKSRQAILDLLFSHSDEAFYLRQITRLTGLNLGSVQRGVERLTRVGIINRVSKGREVFFRANPSCPVFSELKGLIIKTSGAIEAIKRALSPLEEKMELAFIYGSTATGTATADSDIDLFIVGTVTLDEVVLVLSKVEKSLAREINSSIFSEKEFQEKCRRKNHFVRSVMASDLQFLIGSSDELGRLAEK